jgi:tyrosyl-tRNA synthetase
LSRFIDFQDQRAILLNNADWLTRLEYIPFLRDIGRHFSVNKMIKAESYRMRLDSDEGLSFIEFNYMLLQAYDFLELFDRHRCRLQMGGSDQWGNILAGIELIRKARQQTAFGLTFQLITTSSGAKMGKTAAGAVWLDAERTSPYQYYQYWINTDDQDVARFLALYTFLPISEIQEIAGLSGADLNLAKAVLAFETTELVHGREKAIQAMQGAAVMFGARAIPDGILPSSTIPRASDSRLEEAAVPQTFWETDELDRGVPLFKALHMVGLANSGGAARRLIQQGGAYVNGSRIDTAEYVLTAKDAQNHQILLRSGKKKFHKIILRP